MIEFGSLALKPAPISIDFGVYALPDLDTAIQIATLIHLILLILKDLDDPRGPSG